MANTTSGTTTFDKTFSIDEIIEESFERLGIQDVTGYHLKSSRRSLNIMFQEWGNRGLHYWEVGELDLDLIEGQAEYKFFRWLEYKKPKSWITRQGPFLWRVKPKGRISGLLNSKHPQKISRPLVKSWTKPFKISTRITKPSVPETSP